MHTIDQSQRMVDYNVVCFPAYGVMPAAFFRTDFPWTIILNPQTYKKPTSSVKVQVQEVDQELKKIGEPLPLDYFNASPEPLGLPPCVIFRPKGISLTDGKIYLVTVDGLQKVNDKPAPLEYVVVFFNL
jgi:hypothetical protein